MNKAQTEGNIMTFEYKGGINDEPPPDDVPVFRSRRGRHGVDHHRCKLLVEALDGMQIMEDRVERVMTDVLETGGFWHAGGPGEGSMVPTLIEIQVHGVHAFGQDVGQAVANWITAARRRLDGQGGDL